MFVDTAQIIIKAGDGGNGSVNFRKEKFVDRGGPDGGDGGKGGDVIFIASRNENTLSAFRHEKSLKAEPGQAGSKQKKHGKNGEDLVVKVPIGTVISNDDGQVLADLVADGQEAVISKGGRGGFGNAHFVSSVRQAPKFAEIGEKIEAINVKLELKMIADVGLVGLPNAGKSTLLGSLSNAHPTIADYPFTTLTPNLGVVDIDKSTSLLLADIPGIIEGASEGKGLGIEFLRHIERTLVLVHLIDIYNDDVAAVYKTVQSELKAYSVDLTKRPQIVVLNKIDGYDKKILAKKITELKKVVPKGTIVLAISAMSKAGINEFITDIKKIAVKERSRQAKLVEKQKKETPVLKLTEETNSWKIEKDKSGYRVTGARIEKFAGRTDFTNEHSVARLKDIMKKMGIMHELIRRGIKPGDQILIGLYGKFEF